MNLKDTNDLPVLTPAAKAASEFFNSLPTDTRKRLVPLLEEYRLRGLREGLAEIEAARRKTRDRVLLVRGLVEGDVR
jgi:hypothetical protein